jgi:hypothetical protein
VESELLTGMESEREGGKQWGSSAEKRRMSMGCSSTSPGDLAGDRRRRGRRKEITRQSTETEHSRESEPWPRARAGKGFLKMSYGHTGQSTVPVRCTADNTQ